MKKTTKKLQTVKGNLKISNFFIKKEKLDSKQISDTDNNICNTASRNTDAGVLRDDIKISLLSKRKADETDSLSPPKKRSNINILERAVTPDRKPIASTSTNEQDSNNVSPVSNCKSVIYIKSPEQLLSPEALVEYYTPEKKLERFMDKIRTPTPRKRLFNDDQNGNAFLSKVDERIQNKYHSPKNKDPHLITNETTSLGNFTEKALIKTKKTPKKLFDKSPSDVNKFNVQVLKNFIKVTPIKSEKREPDVEFVRTSEKKQCSILKYISPSPSNRSLEAQSRNELTPTKDPIINSSRFHNPSSKVKTKLNFSNCGNEQPSTSRMQQVEISKDFQENIIEDVQSILSSKKCNTSREVLQENNLNLSNLEFCFGDDWHDEIIVPTQQDYKLDLTESQHCKVVNVSAFPTKNVITLKSTKNGEQALCTLEGFWLHSHLNIGDIVHIYAKKINEYEWIVNNDHGLLVYEPDLLISATSVVNTLWCKRKSVLTDCFRGFEPANEAMLVGSLVHSLLQHVLKNKIHNQREIEEVAKNLIKNHRIISNIYDSSLTVEYIEGELLKFVPKIVSFMHLYVKDINTKRQPNLKRNKEDWKGTINIIDDIEENIWCPELGIKGKVDVSVKTDCSNLMPLEVKTGRASVSLEHRGQVLMYIMMMNKLGYQVPSGLLLYLREGVLREIPITQKEKRDIMIMRNELAYYLTRKPKIVEDEQSKSKKLFPPELPEPINHRSCAKCPYNVICTVYAKYNNEDISSMKTLKNIQDEVFFYLEESHLNYFIRWVSLLFLESNSNQGSKDLREIYTLPPEERENNGKCIINLKVTHIGEECNGVYEHTFERHHNELGFNFFSHGITESNYVVVSVANRPAVAAGFVTDITANSMTVTLDRSLNQKYQNKIFYIDSYDSSSIQSYNLTSLTLLMQLTDRAEKLRRIIIDKTPPTFKSRLPKVIGSKGKEILKRLNVVQQRAVLKAIAANDYFLIKGMPGTGKTATIVALIQLLVELGKSVLITSHTHSAVDNVCTRLVNYGVKLLRLGSESRIHPSLKEYSEYNLTKNCTTPEQLEAIYNSAQVLAVTCLGSAHPILSKRVMDICIVDESTQVLQSSVIRPLNSSNTFILIGDPNQLPAIVKSKEARELGMSESLFERLNSKEATIALNLNYRMNSTITALANHLTYDGELLIGSEVVANATIKLQEKEMIKSTYSDWIIKAVDNSLPSAVQFLDTGPICQFKHIVSWRTHKSSENGESNESQRCVNIYEASIVFHLVKALLKAGILSVDIGVIATYRAQVAQISFLLQSDGIDISTVDQFQGKDKSVIIYSSCKSKDVSIPDKSELLEDKRRLTVAITRAKHKLIIVGDVSTLKEYSTFKRILPYLEIIRLNETVDFSWEEVLNNIKV